MNDHTKADANAAQKADAAKHAPKADAAKATAPVVAEAAKPPVAPADTPRDVKALAVSAFTLMHDADGTWGRVWGAKIPTGTPWENVLNDAFWANKAESMNPFDTIVVRHEADEYYAVLLVRQTRTVGQGKTKNRVSVQVLARHDLNIVANDLDVSAFEISFQGRDKKWCVIRCEDRKIIHEGFAEPKDAEMARTLAAQARQDKKPVKSAA